MPRATVRNETQQFDLKTVEGGFVCLRQLSFGEKLARRSFTSKALMRGGGRKGKGEFEAEMDLVSEAALIFSFTHSITDHNLEDEEGNKLNLSTDVGIKQLDPRVGEEIETLIDKLNNFDGDAEDPTS